MEQSNKLTPAEKTRREIAEKSGNLIDLEARQQLQNWIDKTDRDYISGVVLFGRYSRNRGLFFQFNRKQQPEKLFSELNKILANSSPLTTTRGAAAQYQPQTERTAISKNNKLKRDDLPDELKALYDENTEEYKILRALHEKMKQAKTDKDRAKFRAELAALDDAIADRWQIIDTWAESGILPEIAPKIHAKSNELDAKTVSNYRTYIKRGIDTLTDGKITDDAKIDELKDRIKQRYEAMINTNNNFAPETIDKLKEFGIINE